MSYQNSGSHYLLWRQYEGSTLAEFYSIADSSTTILGIPILIAGGCWARRQLHAGIRYVPVASKLRMSVTSVEVV